MPTAEARAQHDEAAFSALLERHRRELQLHCYRMVGSFEDSEDLVQETFLRAWRARSRFSFQNAAATRGWLYRIATNACQHHPGAPAARPPRRAAAARRPDAGRRRAPAVP
jgi:RNA polymerase sigma-70 factor (ECF subfamily)